jgi:Cytidylate kinase-like family
MTVMTVPRKYFPGIYPGKRCDPSEIAGLYIKAWEQKRLEKKTTVPSEVEFPPTICFARQIGVGALEIADILAERIGWRVADRLILEEMAGSSAVTSKTIQFFDERYPGGISALAVLMFGEKSFTMGDYVRGLASVIYALATSEATIFVGRGAHLLLPRDRILAVHLVGSREFRVQRISRIMDISPEAADLKIDDLDREQGSYFKKLTGKRERPTEEFDLLINCDRIANPGWAADIVATAFRCKFMQ